MIYYLLLVLTAMMGLFLWLGICYFEDEVAKMLSMFTALCLLGAIAEVCTDNKPNNEPIKVETSHP